jgi:hypothetical protein
MVAFHEIHQRDDGLWSIGFAEEAPAFESRAFALAVSGYVSPAPAPRVKFRRIKIREVQRNAGA